MFIARNSYTGFQEFYVRDEKYVDADVDFQEFMYVTKYDYANAHFQEFMYVTT